MQVAKACIVPICKNQKFGLVHKFPADKERFIEWMEAIQSQEKMEIFAGLTEDAIRKRFYVCCRHFGLKQYKNIESRSLNLTAVPHLNLTNLDDVELSKAWQLEQVVVSEKLDDPASDKPSSANNPQTYRILNSGAPAVKSVLTCKLAKVVKRPAQVLQDSSENDEYASEKSMIKLDTTLKLVMEKPIKIEPPSKRLKEDLKPAILNIKKPDVKVAKPKLVDATKITDSLSTKPMTKPEEFQKPARKIEMPASSSIAAVPQPEIETLPKPQVEAEKIEGTQQTNKLLALIEVTPDQYERLSKALSSSERNENISSILNFMSKDESTESDDNELSLELEGDKRLKVDFFWLRDHCRCEQCYDHSNHQRKINILDIPDDIKTKSHKITNEKLIVIWNDEKEHESSYDLEFLIKNQHAEIETHNELCLWDKDIIEAPLKTDCRVSMRDYMSDPDVGKKVLESLHSYGVAFIDGVQPTQQNTEFVIRQLFPVHKTLFGEMWTFSDAKKDHSDTAYTNIYLGPHHDNTYFNDAAGLQILHCIQHSATGGENFLIDGFQVAEKIEKEHPEVFNRLTKTIITGEYIEDSRHHKYSAPIIILDPLTGKVEQMRFNLYDRSPLKSVAPGKIRQFYSDLKILTCEMEKLENRTTFKLQPGTVMIFDNWRVLHGRLAYEGKRTMTGCYVARTEFQSALRINGFIE